MRGLIQIESATAATTSSIQALQSQMVGILGEVQQANQAVVQAAQQAAAAAAQHAAAQQAAADRAAFNRAAAAQQAAAAATQQAAQPAAAPVSAAGTGYPRRETGWGSEAVPISIATNSSTGTDMYYISKEIMREFMRQKGITLRPGDRQQQADILNEYFMGNNGIRDANSRFGPGLCPNGFVYHSEGNGIWRCGGGSHAIQFPTS